MKPLFVCQYKYESVNEKFFLHLLRFRRKLRYLEYLEAILLILIINTENSVIYVIRYVGVYEN